MLDCDNTPELCETTDLPILDSKTTERQTESKTETTTASTKTTKQHQNQHETTKTAIKTTTPTSTTTKATTTTANTIPREQNNSAFSLSFKIGKNRHLTSLTENFNFA